MAAAAAVAASEAISARSAASELQNTLRKYINNMDGRTATFKKKIATNISVDLPLVNRTPSVYATFNGLGTHLNTQFRHHRAECTRHRTKPGTLEDTLVAMGRVLTMSACWFNADRAAPAGRAGIITSIPLDAFNTEFASLCPDIYAQHEIDCTRRGVVAAPVGPRPEPIQEMAKALHDILLKRALKDIAENALSTSPFKREIPPFIIRAAVELSETLAPLDGSPCSISDSFNLGNCISDKFTAYNAKIQSEKYTGPDLLRMMFIRMAIKLTRMVLAHASTSTTPFVTAKSESSFDDSEVQDKCRSLCPAIGVEIYPLERYGDHSNLVFVGDR